MQKPAPLPRPITLGTGGAGRSPARSALGRDIAAGLLSAVLSIVYAISFSALLFPGVLQSGMAAGLWMLLAGTLITTLVVAVSTSIPPTDGGPDTPAVAVMSVLSGTILTAVLARGGTPDMAVQHFLLAMVLGAVLTGLSLWLLGFLRLGELLRFVPYPVIGGFLSASGVLLIIGAAGVMSGIHETGSLLAALAGPHSAALLKLVVGFGFAVLVIAIRARTGNHYVLPIAFLAAAILINLVLGAIANVDREAWFVAGIDDLQPVWPIAEIARGTIDWSVIAAAATDICAIAGVTAIALLLDVSSLEVHRARIADLDREFRGHGLANLLSGAGGGVAGNMTLEGSVFIEEAGGATRVASFVAAAAVGLVLVLGSDVASLVPRPLLGGLLAYLGYVILDQALFQPQAGRSLGDLALALAIAVAIVVFGYLPGVLLGLIGACLTFAVNYSRIGVVRRHLTRASFASTVERSPEQTGHLREHGGKIHVFWLSGFIFFGSSNSLFEAIRRTIERQAAPVIRYVILDFSAVSGADTSAVLSLVKLRNFCGQHGVSLVIAGLRPAMRERLGSALVAILEEPHRAFESRNAALEWCEDQLLDEAMPMAEAAGDMIGWLTREMGTGAGELLGYLERMEIAAGTELYAQGTEPDTICLVASGRIAISVTDAEQRVVRLRSMAGQTVVGEMGFFRLAPRSASVAAQEHSVVYILTRERFEDMQRDSPATAQAFLRFIVRVLADRVDFANHEIAALV